MLGLGGVKSLLSPSSSSLNRTCFFQGGLASKYATTSALSSSLSSSVEVLVSTASTGSCTRLKTSESMISMLKQFSSCAECLSASKTSKVISSSPTRSSNYPFCMSMRDFPVARNGRPNMSGISTSSSISSTTKSTGNMNLFTFTNTSSMIPLGYFTDRSANCKDIRVGFNSPNPSFLFA